ncbi:MAG: alpha/beta hydrolase [Patescibacteria group bacterium]
MTNREFSFSVNGTRHQALIVGDLIVGDNDLAKPNFVFLHGASTSTKETVFNFSYELLKQGISILAFDHSAVGMGKEAIIKSGVKTSLAKRVEEAREAISRFASSEPLTICGLSMGADIAIRLLEYFPVKTLVLLVPAIYSRRAFDTPFGDEFSAIIQEKGSWRDSETLELLEKFDGKLLVVYGTKEREDEKFPREVIDLIDRHSARPRKGGRFIGLPDCPHQLFNWLRQNPDWEKEVLKELVQFSSWHPSDS